MRCMALFFVVGILWALPVAADAAPSDPVLSPAEQAEVDKLNAAADALRQKLPGTPRRSRISELTEAVGRESPGELLAKLYLDTESYVMSAVILDSSIHIGRPLSETHGHVDVSYIERNPRFTRALAVLPALPVAERDALLGQHLKKSLELYYAAYQRDVLDRSEYFPPGKENPGLPLGPNRGGWSNPDGAPTIFGLRLGALSLIYLASRMEAKALHAEILAVCRREITQRNFFYDTTRVNERAAAYALNDSLYSRGILAMALKRTAPSDSGVHAVLAETWKADAEKYVKYLALSEVPDDATLHYYPMMSDATFDAAVEAAAM